MQRIERLVRIGFGLALFSLMTALSAYAGMIGWENMGAYGGHVKGIAKDPLSGALYIGILGPEGIFKSVDGGKSWSGINSSGDCTSIVIDPNKGYIYANVKGLSKSTDGGATWKSIINDDVEPYAHLIDSMALDPSNPSIIYAGTGDLNNSIKDATVFKSTDGGATWTKLNLLAETIVRSIAVDPSDSQTIYCVVGNPSPPYTGSYVFKSTDGGTTWKDISPDGGYGFSTLTVDPVDTKNIYLGSVLKEEGASGTLWLSHDGGNSWTPVFSGNVPFVEIDSQNGYIYVRNYMSADGGVNWKLIDPAGDALLVDPQNPNILYAGGALPSGNIGMAKSEDYGETWKPINNGIEGVNIYDMAQNSQANTLFITSWLGFGRSSDSGQDWAFPPALSFLKDGPSVTAVNPANPDIVYTGGINFGIWVSNTNGVHWAPTGLGDILPPRSMVTAIAFDAGDANRMFCGITNYSSYNTGAVYRSDDQGTNWEVTQLKGVPVNALLTVQKQGKTVIYAGVGDQKQGDIQGGIYKSEDLGDTWTQVGLADKVITILKANPLDASVVFAGGGVNLLTGGLYKTINGGETWSNISPLGAPCTIKDILLDPDQPDQVYVSTGDSIFQSSDGGTNWSLYYKQGNSTFNKLILEAQPAAVSKVAVNKSLMKNSASKLYLGTNTGLYKSNSAGIGTVMGMIKDGSTGKGLAGVDISTDIGAEATSLPNGGYMLMHPAGKFTLKVELAGYKTYECDIDIAAEGYLTEDISLTPQDTKKISSGWNLLSYPLVPASSSPESLFSGISSNILSVWKWQDGKWAVWIPESQMSTKDFTTYLAAKGFSLLSVLDNGDGFWVNTNADLTLDMSGTKAGDTSISLGSGWSLIGVKDPETVTIDELLGDQADKIDSVWKWKGNKWAVYLPAGNTDAYATEKGFSLLKDIQFGEGFWVNCTQAVKLQ